MKTRSKRQLKRLWELGYVERRAGVIDEFNPVAEYIYMPAGRTQRPKPHTLKISELYVRLVEATKNTDLEFDYHPEPLSHVRIGQHVLKPDATIKMLSPSLEADLFIEVDLDSGEHEAQLSAKMRRYSRVRHSGSWPAGEHFPIVLFTVPSMKRLRYIKEIIRRQESELFDVCLFDDAVERIIGEVL